MKVLLAISGNSISARLDMTREVIVAEYKNNILIEGPKTILLTKGSAEDLCSFIIQEDISCVVCGGIEEKHFKYLKWKKTRVIDSVIGSHQEALRLLLENKLKEGDIIHGAR